MTDRLPCQVCGRRLVPLKNGTSRSHKPPGPWRRAVDPIDRGDCRGSGHRLARWSIGQHLRHHSGDSWRVVEDRGGRYGDYFMRCTSGREYGREMVAHGEYMHRHGWTAIV